MGLIYLLSTALLKSLRFLQVLSSYDTFSNFDSILMREWIHPVWSHSNIQRNSRIVLKNEFYWGSKKKKKTMMLINLIHVYGHPWNPLSHLFNVHHQSSNATSATEDVWMQCSFTSSHDDISTWWTGVWPRIFPPILWLSHRSLSSPEMFQMKLCPVAHTYKKLSHHVRTAGIIGNHWSRSTYEL